MIFHHPLPFKDNPQGGSQLRPYKMKAAFEELGYEVFLVAGTGGERTKAIRTLKERVRQGARFDFVYSEPPSAPIAVVNHDVLHPWLDMGFLRWCHQQAIPVGLFYRDVYWRFDVYKQNSTLSKRLISIPLFWLEWLSYRRWVDHLFLPSQEMAAALPSPWPPARYSDLPPGCELNSNTSNAKPNGQLDLFYVGGVTTPLYDLTPMLTAIKGLVGVTLTLCCRQDEWHRVQSYYLPYMSPQIKIVHAHSSELADYYARADLFGLFRRVHPYLKFAMPVKVFESLGYGLPIITTTGTAAAEMIQREGIGWSISSPKEFRDLVLNLQAQPDQLLHKRQLTAQASKRHTWLERARTVADTLVNNRSNVN